MYPSRDRTRVAVIHPRLQFARTLRGGCYRYESQCIKLPFSLRAPRPVYRRRIFPDSSEQPDTLLTPTMKREGQEEEQGRAR